MSTLNWSEDMKPAVPGTATSPFTMTDRPGGDFVNKSITKNTNSLTTYDTKSVSILAATTENEEGVDCDDPIASSTNPLNTGKFIKFYLADVIDKKNKDKLSVRQ